MGETTDREKEAKRISGEYGKLGTQVDNEKGFSAFDNYQPKFGMEEFRTAADSVFDKNVTNVNRLTRTNTADATSRSAQSLASRGITGGSIVDEARERIETGISGKGADAIENLGIARSGMETDFMDKFNKLDFAGKKTAMQALMQKYGIKSGALGGQGSMLGGFDDDTLFDDILAVGNTAAQFVPDVKIGL